MEPEEYRLKIERRILEIMERKLMRGEMTAERAQAIARMLLDKLHPPLTLEQIYKIAPSLDEEFTELSAAVLPVLRDRDESIKKVVSAQAEILIKSGRIEEASAILKRTNKS